MITDRNQEQRNDQEQAPIQNVSKTTDATEADGSPVLDEQDLAENNLSVEEADNIEWEEPAGNP